MSIEEHFLTSFQNDLLGMMLGPKIGSGTYREVYEYGLDKTCVVKVEMRGKSFSNVIEWEMWNELRFTRIRKWLAPCVAISPCGIYLIQKRTTPVMKAYPKKIPRIFGDTKVENVGMYNDHICFHDYGNSKIAAVNVFDKFVIAKWWSHEDM